MNTLTLLNKSDLATTSTDNLKLEFAKILKVTADNLAYMSVIWQELHQRGVDLSGLTGGLMEYMPLIASNQLDPHLVVSYAGNKTLLSYLSKLPIGEQETLAKNGSVNIVEIDADHQKIIKNVDLNNIRSSQIFQVFDVNKGIRSEQEQYELLIVKKSVSKKQKLQQITKVKIEDDKIIIGDKFISVKTLLQALSQNTGKDYFSV